jgi:hypothetical protein
VAISLRSRAERANALPRAEYRTCPVLYDTNRWRCMHLLRHSRHLGLAQNDWLEFFFVLTFCTVFCVCFSVLIFIGCGFPF